MKKRYVTILFLLAASLFIIAGCGSKKEKSTSSGKVVGEVGGEKVTWKEFKKQLDALPPYYRRFLQRSDAQATYLKKYLIRKAMVKEAEARGYDKDPAILRQIERFKEQLLIRKLREEERKKNATVTDDEIKQYYEQHKDQYKVGEERKIREIMVKVPPNASKKVWEEAKKKIEKAYRELKRGKPWNEVFKKYNEDESIKFTNGELPYFPKDKRLRFYIDKNFIDAVFSMKKGETRIVKTNFGYHLIQLEDIKPPHTREFIEVAPEIKRQLEQRKRIMQEKKLEDMLVKKYHIKVFKDALGNKQPTPQSPKPPVKFNSPKPQPSLQQQKNKTEKIIQQKPTTSKQQKPITQPKRQTGGGQQPQ